MVDPSVFDPGPLSPVERQPAGDRWTLTFVRDLPHPPPVVWETLTDPARVGRWAPYTPDRDLGEVGPASLTMTDGVETMDFPSTVSAAEPPVLLEYTWGDGLLRWELVENPTGTRVTLRHTVESTEWLPKVAAGWHLCLVVAGRQLAGDPIGPIVGDDAMDYGWQQLHDAYAVALAV